MKKIYTPRTPSPNRLPAGNRTPTPNRTLIPSPNNGKLNVIIDTSIIVSALIAQSQKHTDSASYRVIEELKKDSFNLIQPHDLSEEYKHDLLRLAPSKGFTQTNIDVMLGLIASKGYTGRSYVIPVIEPKDEDDRGVFNTTLIGIVDYVVSVDSRHLVNREIKNLPEKIKVLEPNDFLKKLRSHTSG